jgi:hypothetical protein
MQKLKGDEMKEWIEKWKRFADEKLGFNEKVELQVQHIVYASLALFFVFVVTNCHLDELQRDLKGAGIEHKY